MGNNFISVYIGSFGFTTPDQSKIDTVKFGSRSGPGFLMETKEKIACFRSVVFLTVVIVDKETFSSSPSGIRVQLGLLSAVIFIKFKRVGRLSCTRIPVGDEEKVSSRIFHVEIPNNPCPLVEVISEGFNNVTSG